MKEIIFFSEAWVKSGKWHDAISSNGAFPRELLLSEERNFFASIDVCYYFLVCVPAFLIPHDIRDFSKLDLSSKSESHPPAFLSCCDLQQTKIFRPNRQTDGQEKKVKLNKQDCKIWKEEAEVLRDEDQCCQTNIPHTRPDPPHLAIPVLRSSCPTTGKPASAESPFKNSNTAAYMPDPAVTPEP